MRDSRSGYLATDTIAALSTALGGAIAIVRVSGPRAFEVLDGLTRAGFTEGVAPRTLELARLHSPEGAPLDSVLAARFVAPDSFSGENLVELNVHGGAFVASRVLEATFALGARPALPGEFSFRAVRNGKLSLTQAQAVADLIAAPNEGALALALEKLSGSQARAVQEISEGLRRVAVLSEVGIDFSDQDLDEVRLPTLQRELTPIRDALVRLEASYDRGSRIQAGVRTAFVGAPNVGKSSLFNALLGEDRSIVSEIAGTTRDVIREQLTLRGSRASVTLRLEDTAGLRAADDPIEREGIARSRRSAHEADLVLLLVDPTQDTAEQQWALLDGDRALAKKTIGVITKTDRPGAPRPADIGNKYGAKFGIPRWVATSAVTGDGIAALVEAITLFCETWLSREKGEVLLTRFDHLEAVRATLDHLARANQAHELDLFASDLRQALSALAPLIGETLPDDILGRIFSDFCIGK